MITGHAHVFGADRRCTMPFGRGLLCHARQCAADGCTEKASAGREYCVEHRALERSLRGAAR